MIVKLLTEHHLEFLSLTGGCGGSSESTLVKMSNCWKSQSTAQLKCYEHFKSIPADSPFSFNFVFGRLLITLTNSHDPGRTGRPFYLHNNRLIL